MRQRYHDDGDRSWNMFAAFMEQLSNRRNDKALAMLESDLGKWFTADLEIVISISPYLEKDPLKGQKKSELQELRDMLDEVENNLKQTPPEVSNYDETIRRRTSAAADKLRNLDFKIMEKLYKYKMIPQKSKTETIEEEIADDFDSD